MSIADKEEDAPGVAPEGAGTSPAPGEADRREEAGLVAVPLSADAELAGLRKENDALKDQLLRRRAEFENFRRRTDRERRTWALDAEAAVIGELITAIDHLEHAVKSDAGERALREGVELTLRDLMASLGKLGLDVLDPVGHPFDPLVHQALSHEAVPDVEDGTVLETYRAGYVYKGRLLRPALVKVVKGTATAEAASPAADGGQTDGPSGPDGSSVGGPEAVHLGRSGR
jgi:molecular chaperone GrpE